MSENALEDFIKRLGYVFQNPELIHTALRHRSMGKDNNERLEFLGDSVVNCVVANMLFQRFPDACEGGLSRLRAELVNRDYLAGLANKLALGDVIVLGAGELKSGGFRRASILSDALEAVVGAMLLDSDFATVEKIILSWYAEGIKSMSPDSLDKDGKTALQEWLQSKQEPLPQYTIDSVEGDAHDQMFNVSCRVDGVDHLTHGEGRTRRRAEQQAADAFLAWLHHEES